MSCQGGSQGQYNNCRRNRHDLSQHIEFTGWNTLIEVQRSKIGFGTGYSSSRYTGIHPPWEGWAGCFSWSFSCKHVELTSVHEYRSMINKVNPKLRHQPFVRNAVNPQVGPEFPVQKDLEAEPWTDAPDRWAQAILLRIPHGEGLRKCQGRKVNIKFTCCLCREAIGPKPIIRNGHKPIVLPILAQENSRETQKTNQYKWFEVRSDWRLMVSWICWQSSAWKAGCAKPAGIEHHECRMVLWSFSRNSQYAWCSWYPEHWPEPQVQ